MHDKSISYGKDIHLVVKLVKMAIDAWLYLESYQPIMECEYVVAITIQLDVFWLQLKQKWAPKGNELVNVLIIFIRNTTKPIGDELLYRVIIGLGRLNIRCKVGEGAVLCVSNRHSTVYSQWNSDNGID